MGKKGPIRVYDDVKQSMRTNLTDVFFSFFAPPARMKWFCSGDGRKRSLKGSAFIANFVIVIHLHVLNTWTTIPYARNS